VQEIRITRHVNPALANPFPMGQTGHQEGWRRTVVELHARWLRLGTVAAEDMRMPDGARLPRAVTPPSHMAHLMGRDAERALLQHFESRRAGVQWLRLVCSTACSRGRHCHGEALASRLRSLAEQDASEAAAAQAAAADAADAVHGDVAAATADGDAVMPAGDAADAEAAAAAAALDPAASGAAGAESVERAAAVTEARNVIAALRSELRPTSRSPAEGLGEEAEEPEGAADDGEGADESGADEADDDGHAQLSAGTLPEPERAHQPPSPHVHPPAMPRRSGRQAGAAGLYSEPRLESSQEERRRRLARRGGRGGRAGRRGPQG